MNILCCSKRNFLSITRQYTEMPCDELQWQRRQRGQHTYPSERGHSFFIHSLGVLWVTGPSSCPFMMWEWLQAAASAKHFTIPHWLSLTMPIPSSHVDSLFHKLSSSVRKKKKSHICLIRSPWFISLCVKEVSRRISLTLAVDKYVQQWVSGLLERLLCMRDP